eukprot:COSAG01_NODE_2017_length_8638_cov_15.453917_9_plen_61_part_00
MMSTACHNTLCYLASPCAPLQLPADPPPFCLRARVLALHTHIHRGLAAQQPWAWAVSAAD